MRGAFASLVALAAWMAAAVALAQPADPAQTFAEASAALAKHTDGSGFLDDQPEASAILQQVWRAAEAVAARAPDDAGRTKTTLAALDKDMDVQVVPLGASARLVSLQINGDGDVFIVKDGAVAWRIGDAPPASAEFRPLRAWAAQPGCRERVSDEDWAECGGLGAGVGLLPNDALGHARFWVNAVYAQRAGETESGQISFWVWNGGRAVPLLLRVYALHIDSGGPPSLAGDVLSLPVKDDFLTVDSCGACAGRERTWRFEITSAAVRDLGKVSAVPQLDLIDELYDRALHGRPLAPLATPAAARAIVASAGAIDRADPHPSLGMSSGWTLSADHERLCFSADGLGAMQFTLARSQAGLVVTSARRLGDDSCADLVHWPDATSGD